MLLAGALAGLGQLTDQSPSFGQGLEGYGHRLAASYADQAMGNMFTEGLFPVLLHEDPRYFRRGTGTTVSRVGYALTRVLVTHKDSGGRRFNYSEFSHLHQGLLPVFRERPVIGIVVFHK